MLFPPRQFLFLFLIPAVEVIFFCAAVGHDPYDLPLAVVNHELGFPSSQKNCTVYPGCDFKAVSCRVFDHLFNKTTFR